MSVKRKRLNVTLSDSVWELVNEVHSLNGVPKSAIISELLDQIAPVFQSQVQALRILKESPQEAQRILRTASNESIARLAQASLDLDAAFDARTVQGQRAKRIKGEADGTP